MSIAKLFCKVLAVTLMSLGFVTIFSPSPALCVESSFINTWLNYCDVLNTFPLDPLTTSLNQDSKFITNKMLVSGLEPCQLTQFLDRDYATLLDQKEEVKDNPQAVSLSSIPAVYQDVVPPKNVKWIKGIKQQIIEAPLKTNLVKFLQEIGSDTAQTKTIIKALRKITATKKIPVDGKVSITLLHTEKQCKIQELRFCSNDQKHYLLKRDVNDNFHASSKIIKLKRHLGQLRIPLNGSITKELKKCNLPKILSQEILKKSGLMPKNVIGVKTAVEVVYEVYKNDADEISKVGNIQYYAFRRGKRGQNLCESPFNNQPPSNDRQTSRYDVNSGTSKSTGLGQPLEGRLVVNSPFSYNRLHPIRGCVKAHLGVDFKAAHGTVVRCANDGVIIKSGYMGAYGNCVVVRHRNNYSTLYAHLSKFGPNIRPGSTVHQGQELGRVGATGTATSPHLHYGVMVNNVFVDPMKVKMTRPLHSTKELPKKFTKIKYSKRLRKTSHQNHSVRA